MQDKPTLILASGSPRRRELIARLGYPFACRTSGLDEEKVEAPEPSMLASRLARMKARRVAGEVPSGLVLGFDTLVCLDGRILGKPTDRHDARQMLRALRGRTHDVITAVAAVEAASGREETAVVLSRVRMRRFGQSVLSRYLDTGDSLDKAGAYGIQTAGAGLVESFSGCYFNIVGLPLCELARLLDRFGRTPDPPRPACILPDGRICPRWEGSSVPAASRTIAQRHRPSQTET